MVDPDTLPADNEDDNNNLRLRPQLNLFDAVATGLAVILGAGIFSVIAPAAGIAGPALLVSLGIGASIACVMPYRQHSLRLFIQGQVVHMNLDDGLWGLGGDI